MACGAAASLVNIGDVLSRPDDGSKGKNGQHKKRQIQVIILQNNQLNLSYFRNFIYVSNFILLYIFSVNLYRAF